MYYILKNKKIVKTNDIVVWGKFMGSADKIVKQTKITDKINVSTVFLGLDHKFTGEIPILFETMIFGGEHNQYQERYSTWDEAEKGHIVAVKLASLS